MKIRIWKVMKSTVFVVMLITLAPSWVGAVGFVGATQVAGGCPGWTGPEDGSSQSCDYWFTVKVTSGGMTQGEAHQWALRKLYTDGLWSWLRYEMVEWTLLGNPNLGMNPLVGPDAIFVDGFESGDTVGWDVSVP